MRKPRVSATLCLFAGVACALVAASGAAAAPTVLHGVVQSGGTVSTRPLGGVRVTLLEATAGQPVVLGQSTSDAAGRFAISSPKDAANGVFSVSAAVDKGVDLVSVLGQSLPSSTTVNELTTVAAGYAMAQFTDDGAISGDPFALELVAGMNDNIVDAATLLRLRPAS